MRLSALLGVAVLALSVRDVAADPRRPRRPAPAPVTTSAPARGTVALRTPGPDRILNRGGSFEMGADDLEVAHAVTLCRLEPGGEDERSCNDKESSLLRCYCSEREFSHETAAHEVYLSPFWIDRTEVTVARYRRCVAAGRCSEPQFAAGGERFDRPDYPVVLVSFNDAQDFCAFAGGRLPTEAEWELAAKGLAGRRYPWGNVYNPMLSNHGRLAIEEHDAVDGFFELAPVGSFPDGRTPDGLDDMAGNAEEWVADWFDKEYPKASAVNPKGPDSGEVRVVRGGSFVWGRPWLRTTARLYEPPGERRADLGFRCAASAG